MLYPFAGVVFQGAPDEFHSCFSIVVAQLLRRASFVQFMDLITAYAYEFEELQDLYNRSSACWRPMEALHLENGLQLGHSKGFEACSIEKGDNGCSESK